MAELEIDSPSVQCGACHFTSGVAGEWSVEDGRLVFRAADDPLPWRGASIGHCGECGAEFDAVSLLGNAERWLAPEQHATLKASAEKAWQAIYGPS